MRTTLAQIGEAVKFNEVDTDAAKLIRSIEVYWPFDMVAYFSQPQNKFTSGSCSCGWTHHCKNENVFVTESRLHNHWVNHEFSKILTSYKNNEINYDTAQMRLLYHGMTDDRADYWLDRVKGLIDGS